MELVNVRRVRELLFLTYLEDFEAISRIKVGKLLRHSVFNIPKIPNDNPSKRGSLVLNKASSNKRELAEPASKHYANSVNYGAPASAIHARFL